MLKKTGKLLSLLLLLTLSFIYTDKVFSTARKNDPVMKKVLSYKNNNYVKAVEPVIKKDELTVGAEGYKVNEKQSYKNMKADNKFDADKIVYEKKLPKTSISNNYDYYIKKGNPKKNYVSIIIKVKEGKNLSEILNFVAKNNISINFFVDGTWLLKNVDQAFSINNLNCEIYNLGYNLEYDKSNITNTNNLIESITLKDAKFCLNESKNDEYKKICKYKKMHSILPSLISPSYSELKKGLSNGIIISYDEDDFDSSMFSIYKNVITSRGYEIKPLSKLVSEKR